DITGGAPRKLAGTGTAVPGGAGSFSGFEARAAVKNGIVLFIGFDANFHPGVYTVPAAGGAVIRLADTTTAIPGAPVLFTAFDRGGLSHDGSTALFTARGQGVSGVYSIRMDGSSLARVADSNTPVNSSTCDLFPVATYG